MTAAERIASALEVLASSVQAPDETLMAQVLERDEIIREFVRLMKTSESTNEEWTDLFNEAIAMLGIPEGVAS